MTDMIDSIEQRAFDCTKAVNDYLLTVSHDDMRLAAYCELARTAGRIMRFLVDADLAEEHFNDLVSEAGAQAYGHMTMQAIGPMINLGSRSDVKKFLVDVAEVLGPDHVEGFRRAGVFMAKVDQF